MIPACTNGPEENNPSLRRVHPATFAGQLLSFEIVWYSRWYNGHLSWRERALSRAAAYEKAPRRNN